MTVLRFFQRFADGLLFRAKGLKNHRLNVLLVELVSTTAQNRIMQVGWVYALEFGYRPT